MTAPAKAAPMREDVTQAALELHAKWKEACDRHTALLADPKIAVESSAVRYSGQRCASLYAALSAAAIEALAHTARPDAVSMDAKADNMDAHPVAGDEDVERVEVIAKIIDPISFRAWQSLYEYCLNDGDTEEWSRDCADGHHLKSMNEARHKARAALAAMREGVDRGMVERARQITEQLMTHPQADANAIFLLGVAGTRIAALDTEQPR